MTLKTHKEVTASTKNNHKRNLAPCSKTNKTRALPALRLLFNLAPALGKIKHTHTHFVSHQWDTHQVKKLVKRIPKK